jgi:hypothetical protein
LAHETVDCSSQFFDGIFGLAVVFEDGNDGAVRGHLLLSFPM